MFHVSPAAGPPASDPPAAGPPAADSSTDHPTAVSIVLSRQSAPVSDPSMVGTSAVMMNSSFTLCANSAFCHDYNTNVSEKMLLSCHPDGQDCAISDICDEENLSVGLL